MHSESDLEILMARYQQGDYAAATALIHQLSAQLHRFFLVQFVGRGDADDLLQETWLRIHEVRHTYRTGEPVLPWFYAIARHIRVDHYRRALRTTSREQPLGEVPEPAAASPAPSARSPIHQGDPVCAELRGRIQRAGAYGALQERSEGRQMPRDYSRLQPRML